jgi:hypothetical protein
MAPGRDFSRLEKAASVQFQLPVFRYLRLNNTVEEEAAVNNGMNLKFL